MENIKQFLLNMQHDIQTPVSNIIGLTNVISSMQDVPEKIREYIGYIKISSERLLDLMTEILEHCDIAKPTITLTSNKEWTFSLTDLIQNTVDLNIITIQDKGLKVVINKDSNIPKNLIGNQDKLHRIFINLLDNALKFTSKGTITITTKLIKIINSNLIIELTVKDTGIGIHPDKHEDIFDRFTKLSPSNDNMHKGLGLGLWMVNQLTKEIGGKIHVNSSVGTGSTFKCIFPCKASLVERHEHIVDN